MPESEFVLPKRVQEYWNHNNPLPVAVLLISTSEGVVLFQRKQEPVGPSLISGFLDNQETGQKAAIREALEETGLDISGEQIDFSGVAYGTNTVLLCYNVRLESIAVDYKFESEEGTAFFVKHEDLKDYKLVFPQHQKFLDQINIINASYLLVDSLLGNKLNNSPKTANNDSNDADD